MRSVINVILHLFYVTSAVSKIKKSLNFPFKSETRRIFNMSSWRAAGLNYINYSTIAAKLLRQALKPEFRAEAAKRNESHVRITKWIDGKPEKKTDPAAGS